jgi:hypothetical protein
LYLSTWGDGQGSAEASIRNSFLQQDANYSSSTQIQRASNKEKRKKTALPKTRDQGAIPQGKPDEMIPPKQNLPNFE